jgi:cyclopropane-fatty-acyl-phospholipid synthase
LNQPDTTVAPNNPLVSAALHHDKRIPKAGKLLISLLQRLHVGSLRLTLPSGESLHFSGPQPGPEADLQVHDWRFAGMALRSAEIGFAEAYRDGYFDTSSLAAILELAVLNQQILQQAFYGNKFFALIYRVAHRLRSNTRNGSKKNIHAHYDLGNEFYSLWLDNSMTYSSALFNKDFSQNIEDAQHAKYERILAQLAIQPGQHILEIGCGWGGFAEYAAKTRGVKTTGITISQAQYDFATQRIAHAGLSHLVDLRMVDYRDVRGEFDAVVSIEMFEAVGEAFWPTYFNTLRDRLKRGGRAVVQTITIAHDAFDYYRNSSDFIREYIFPGGMLPSVPIFSKHAHNAGLQEVHRHEFGLDYAETLRRWNQRFDTLTHQIDKLGFDEAFRRIWRFYFAYCEAGFRSGRTNVMQVELLRP